MEINLNFINTEEIYHSYLQASYYFSSGKDDNCQNSINNGPELSNLPLKRGKESPLYPYWRIAMRELQHIIAPWSENFAWKNEYTEVVINIKTKGSKSETLATKIHDNVTGVMDLYLWENILYTAKIRRDDRLLLDTKNCLLEWLCYLES